MMSIVYNIASGIANLVYKILCKYSRKNEKIIKEYIKNQLQEDIAYAQISLQEYIDPFTGEKVEKKKKRW